MADGSADSSDEGVGDGEAPSTLEGDGSLVIAAGDGDSEDNGAASAVDEGVGSASPNAVDVGTTTSDIVISATTGRTDHARA